MKLKGQQPLIQVLIDKPWLLQLLSSVTVLDLIKRVIHFHLEMWHFWNNQFCY